METSRVEAFSDGVFAITITLLVVGIAKPPADAAVGAELLGLWPSYVAYAASFLLVGAIWVNHHAMFRHIVRADGMLLVLNLLQLMLFAFVPFPTIVLAEAFRLGRGEGIAAAFYGGVLGVGGVFVNAVWWYAARDRRLLSPDLSTHEARRIGRRYLLGPAFYAAAVVVGLLLPWIALGMYVMITAFFLWPRGIDQVALAGSAASGAPLPPREESMGDRDSGA